MTEEATISALRRWARLFAVIFAIHALVGVLEMFNLSSCRGPAPECWAYFFIVLVDLPISLVVGEYAQSAIQMWSFEHFWAVNLTVLLAYVIVGSLWWTFIVWGVRSAWAHWRKR